jgi:hypothetical protein
MTAEVYIANHFSKVHGWLLEQAVHVTGQLMAAQADLDIPGINLEIGVWRGKYLGAIIATAPWRDAYALDIWLHNQAAEVEQFLSSVSPGTRVATRRANTAVFCPERLRETIDGNAVAFASVDGSHEARAVERDLRNVAACLSPGGVIAIDDFLNPLTLGVAEGTLAFLASGGAIEPICYVANKLFVTTPTWSEAYQIRLRMWLEAGAAAAYFNRERYDWAGHTTYLLSRKLLVL